MQQNNLNILMLSTYALLMGMQISVSAATTTTTVPPPITVPGIFEPDYKNQLVLEVEAALATAQAEFNIIPATAAKEITAKANTQYATLEDIAAENDIVQHRMVALLNVWGRSLDGDAAQYLHFGATTVDIYDTVKVLQLRLVCERLLERLYVADWHGVRDVFAEYAQVLALISKSWGRIGTELFLLQTTDIAETVEARSSTAVGSSTMPHKNNPSKSEALIHYSRTIPRLAEVVLDDVENYFERDNTSRPNRVLDEISIEADGMLRTANGLLKSLRINSDVMLVNLQKTKGLIMSQRVAFALADQIGKKTANDKMHEVAKQALQQNLSLREAFEASELASLLSSEDLDQLLDVTTYTGLASQQTSAVIEEIKNLRKAEGR